MAKQAVVLGCGLVGATIVRDLSDDPDFTVTAVDVSEDNLRRVSRLVDVTTRKADVSNPKSLHELVAGADIVLGALPSRFGFKTLQTVIESGKPYCDISFMPEDADQLDVLARERGVTAVVDCGVSPGLSHLIVGHVYEQLDTTNEAVIYVGGLPKIRRWPYEYKAPFAPADVLEIYTRPARVRENGQIAIKPALSDPELVEFPHVGTLEAFNTDGLRSLLTTIPVPNMIEKTLRYPGHARLMEVLRESGFLGKDEVRVGGSAVRPIDLASRLLFPLWTLEDSEEEFTVLRVVVSGVKDGKPRRHTYDLYDEYDRAAGTTSMARTTGFPCTIVARMIADGTFSEPGVFPPESLAKTPGAFQRIIDALKTRAVTVEENVEDGSG
ncbi:MAG: saccharopine dehydrogenase family protein [Phycisphaerae bacterium]